MPSRVSLLLGCCLLGILVSFLPWVDRLELPLYDLRMEIMLDEERRGIPLHPLIRLVGRDPTTRRRFPGWGPAEDARLGANFSEAGALGVVLLRHHEMDYTPPAPIQAVQEATGIFAQGLRIQDAAGHLAEDWESRLEQSAPLPGGSIDFVVDSDQIVRRAFLAIRRPDGKPPVPSAALLMFARLKGVEESLIRYGHDSIQVGDTVIPTAPNYTLPVRLLDPRSIDLKALANSEEGIAREVLIPISAGGLLDRDAVLYQHYSEGRVVLLGDYEKQASEQLITSLGEMKYLQFQGCLLDTLLGNWHLRNVPPSLQLALLAAFTLGATALAGNFRPFRALLVLVALSGALAWLGYWLFLRGWLLNLAQPLVAAIVSSLALKLHQLISIMRNLRKFGGSSAFEAARSLDESHLVETRERVSTILFCNMPDWLRQLESEESKDYFRRRQEFSVMLNDIAQANQGIVLDFQGDAPMLGFGTELRRSDPLHAYHAVRAGLEIVGLSERLEHLWPEVGNPELLRLRCGVCTGKVALGHVGARGSKLAQAAIGDTTNVAARLMGAARRLQVDILVTETTREQCDRRFEFEDHEPIALKGKTEPVAVACLRAEPA